MSNHFSITSIDFIFGELLALIWLIVLLTKMSIVMIKIFKFIDFIEKEAEPLKDLRNHVNGYKVVKFPKIIIDHMLEFNLPKMCLVCGQQEYKGDFKTTIGASKNYIILPLCNKHYDLAKSMLGKKYTKEMLEFNFGYRKLFLPLFIYVLFWVFSLYILYYISLIIRNLVVLLQISHNLIFVICFTLFVFHILNFMYKAVVVGGVSGTAEKNLQLDFSGKDYFAFTVINDEWIKEFKRLNPHKEFEIRILPKLTRKYYKELYK